MSVKAQNLSGIVLFMLHHGARWGGWPDSFISVKKSRCPPQRRPGEVHDLYVWVSARKIPLSPNEFEPRTAQPVASRYNVYVIPAIVGKYNVSVSMIHGGRTFLRNLCTHKSYQTQNASSLHIFPNSSFTMAVPFVIMCRQQLEKRR